MVAMAVQAWRWDQGGEMIDSGSPFGGSATGPIAGTRAASAVAYPPIANGMTSGTWQCAFCTTVKAPDRYNPV